MRVGETLISPETESPWTYFPETGVISLVRGFRDGSHIEVGVIGSEGMAGVHAFLGQNLEPAQALVQCDGVARRIRKDVLRREFDRGGILQALLLRFTHALLTQLSLTAACNQLHSIDQRLARWLLAMNDRMVSREIPLSHEFLAHMLGTGRARVTEAIGKFRAAGAVGGSRGRILIEDPVALARSACECYDDIRDVYEGVENTGPTAPRQ